MKKKNILILVGIMVLAISMAACSKSNEQDDIAPTPTVTVAPTPEATPTPELEPTTAPEEDGTTDGTDGTVDGEEETGIFLGTDTAEIEAMYNAIVEELGDDFVAQMALGADEISALFGVQADWYDGIVAVMPMMSVHVDKLVIVKASEGHLEDVKAALENQLAVLKEDTMQYPMNLAKIQGGLVDTFDDFVIFSMLGFADESIEDEATAIAAYMEINNNLIGLAKEAR